MRPPVFLTRYIDMSLLTVTFLSISVDLLIFIIFAFAYQMPDYDMSFLVEIVAAWLFDFIFNEVNTLFAKMNSEKKVFLALIC